MWVQMCLKCREATKNSVGCCCFVNITKNLHSFSKTLKAQNHIHCEDETLASMQGIDLNVKNCSTLATGGGSCFGKQL